MSKGFFILFLNHIFANIGNDMGNRTQKCLLFFKVVYSVFCLMKTVHDRFPVLCVYMKGFLDISDGIRTIKKAGKRVDILMK